VGERKSHFLDTEVHKSSTVSQQVFVRYMPLYCIWAPATNNINARDYVLMIRMFKFVSITASTFTVLEVLYMFCLICGTGAFQC
jgi:hypothetical protein